MGVAMAEDESAYKDVIDEDHGGALLRQVFVHREALPVYSG
jgi:hypothetical protein